MEGLTVITISCLVPVMTRQCGYAWGRGNSGYVPPRGPPADVQLSSPDYPPIPRLSG